ncbi:hypothetical protein FOZ60_003837 [Perkinsus olseni]|uniref:Uncharacterized protein n=1 Tax=Perkinsus olseni TaxID=32597 RepID=A0A7J6NUP7_PEROL|nr:hypothetical protein FOZ60_003837 [Perkinsus olseni]
MVISPRFFAVILFVLVPRNDGAMVSFSSQEWVLPTDHFCNMFSRGVNKFYLEGATLLFNGSIYSEVKNVTMVNEIADCAGKYGTSMSLLLWTDESPFDECSPRKFNFDTFKHQLQSYITQYDVEEVTFWIWAGPVVNCEQFFWQISTKISRIIRRSLKTRSGKPVRASLGFSVEPSDSPLWKYIKSASVGKYFDTITVHFGYPGLHDRRTIDDGFARDVVHRLLTYGVPAHQIELSTDTDGFNELTFIPMAYFELIREGASRLSNGSFHGYIYQSQKQVYEKTNIIKEEGLRGLSLRAIIWDTPVDSCSSLLYAALYYLPDSLSFSPK